VERSGGKQRPKTVLPTGVTVEEMRRLNSPYAIFTPAQGVDYIKEHGTMPMSPLCGGAPPELGWASLRLLADEVLPQLKG